MKRYGKSPAGRIAASSMLRAVGVLIRHHPKAALDMAGSGLKEAGRSGIKEIKKAMQPSPAARSDKQRATAEMGDRASGTEPATGGGPISEKL